MSEEILRTVTWFDSRLHMNKKSPSTMLRNLDLGAFLRLQHNLAPKYIVACCVK